MSNSSAAQSDALNESVTATLSGTELSVPPARRWKARAVNAIQNGDFQGWAEIVLSDENYDKWIDADPTVGDVEEFFAELMPKAGLGDGAGNSQGSRRQSKNTGNR